MRAPISLASIAHCTAGVGYGASRTRARTARKRTYGQDNLKRGGRTQQDRAWALVHPPLDDAGSGESAQG
ncbi:hypothetical protein [Nonomuraea sp. B19D2]|uniref:hypothetical protein n=1 Tax=Nonomuraea sp. B19D2 TaxID=3159561 RepID=UPI0032DA2F05